MASLWQRLTTKVETRAVQQTIPSREATVVNAETALTLTAVYRAIQILATPISKMPINTYRFATGIEERIENPLIINRPSLLQSRRDFMYQTVADLALKGGAVWFKTRNLAGEVTDLTIVPYDAVSMAWNDPNDMSKGVDFGYAGKTYSSKDIEHLRLFTRAGQIRGVSPIDSAAKDIASAIELRDYAANWFSAAGVPTGVIKSSQLLSKAEADEITANWHNKQQNRQVAVLGNSMDYAQVALSPKDALFTEVQNQSIQAIARLMGIPARLLITSVPGSSDTYSNLVDEQAVFWRHTLMSYTDAITDALSNCLPRGTRVEFDYEHLFKADAMTRYQTYKVGLEAGFLTEQYVQEKEGLNA